MLEPLIDRRLDRAGGDLGRIAEQATSVLDDRDADFRDLTKVQEAARTGDPDGRLAQIRDTDDMVRNTLHRAGAPAMTSQVQRTVQDRIASFERTMGGKATWEQQQEIVDRAIDDAGRARGGDILRDALEREEHQSPAS